MATNNFYGAIALTGGTAGALDAIPSAALNDFDFALVSIDGIVYFFHFDSASSAVESSPQTIKPDDIGAGNGRWTLQSIAVNSTASTTEPRLRFDVTNGIGYSGGGEMSLIIANAAQWRFFSNIFAGDNSNAPALISANSTSILPNICPSKADLDTGLAWDSADILALTAGGVNGFMITELNNGCVVQHPITAGITASTTQTQGQQPLISSINQISVCANANDVVTMPIAKAGSIVTIINSGANTLQIFPATSGTISGGAPNASVTLAAGAKVTYHGINTTAWL